MYSIPMADPIQDGIQWVLWSVLAVFFGMAVLGWWVASREWLKDEQEPGEKGPEEQPGPEET